LPLDRALDPTLFRALADETRLRILACLLKCGRACTVGEVAQCCSVDLSVVSRHLKALQDASLLSARRAGREVWYTARSADFVRTLRHVAQSVEACRQAGASCTSACSGSACECEAGSGCVPASVPPAALSAKSSIKGVIK